MVVSVLNMMILLSLKWRVRLLRKPKILKDGFMFFKWFMYSFHKTLKSSLKNNTNDFFGFVTLWRPRDRYSLDQHSTNSLISRRPKQLARSSSFFVLFLPCVNSFLCQRRPTNFVVNISHICHVNVFSSFFMDDELYLRVALWKLALPSSSEEWRGMHSARVLRSHLIICEA